MKILVINAGSSSLKYQLLEMDGEAVLARGVCERIGAGGVFEHKTSDGYVQKKEVEIPDHTEALHLVTSALTQGEGKVLSSLDEIDAVGHRIAQGGSLFHKSVLIDKSVLHGIESLIQLAPLHNGPELKAILACRELFGEQKPEVAVFDTAFHSTIPPKAYLYAIPYRYYQTLGIRRYGFHGTSHRYVSGHCAELMGKQLEGMKMITCHIGNGASLAAIQDGRVVDTSMGLTPLDGVMMGTRSGSVDPSVVVYLMEQEHLTPQEISDLLNRKSGMLGISGYSDDRDVTKAEIQGQPLAALAHEMMYYQIAKYIGAYAVAMDGVDCIVFTAGLGENQPILRSGVCGYLGHLGVELDAELNDSMVGGKEGKISSDDSRVCVYIIRTNEELLIARDTEKIASRFHYASMPDAVHVDPEDV